jgi:hypothetical protein
MTSQNDTTFNGRCNESIMRAEIVVEQRGLEEDDIFWSHSPSRGFADMAMMTKPEEFALCWFRRITGFHAGANETPRCCPHDDTPLAPNLRRLQALYESKLPKLPFEALPVSL